ncbi:MAG: OsmC family protein [Deltaproteobacteria bacterium]|nr:OsmC family protein [Deltaproteobacteria bacterium]
MSAAPDITITFPGGKRVDARIGDRVIRTDQPSQAGGDGSAPMPFELFLASIGTCAGIYVLGFLQSRGLATDGVEVRQRLHYDEVTYALAEVGLEIKLPPSVPEKYHAAIIRAADTCAVKKAIQTQPKFAVRVVGSDD